MDIVGVGSTEWGDDHVHTIDVWFSERRKCWVVERLNHHGDLVGTAHCCTSLADAEHCVAEWLRTHDETHLSTPNGRQDARAEATSIPRKSDPRKAA